MFICKTHLFTINKCMFYTQPYITMSLHILHSTVTTTMLVILVVPVYFFRQQLGIVVSRLCDMKVKTKMTTYRYTFQHIISQIVNKHFFFLELQVWRTKLKVHTHLNFVSALSWFTYDKFWQCYSEKNQLPTTSTRHVNRCPPVVEDYEQITRGLHRIRDQKDPVVDNEMVRRSAVISWSQLYPIRRSRLSLQAVRQLGDQL